MVSLAFVLVASNSTFALSKKKHIARAASNQIYVPELDRIVLGDKRGTRSFLNVKVRWIYNVMIIMYIAEKYTYQ